MCQPRAHIYHIHIYFIPIEDNYFFLSDLIRTGPGLTQRRITQLLRGRPGVWGGGGGRGWAKDFLKKRSCNILIQENEIMLDKLPSCTAFGWENYLPCLSVEEKNVLH